MTISDSLGSGPARRAGLAGAGVDRALEARAVALHSLNRLRVRHFVSPALADPAMSLMLTLFIGECQAIMLGEQGVLLANQVEPAPGATLLDTLVHAGLIVATGETPGRRSVGLTPLGSARMRAFIADSSELM